MAAKPICHGFLEIGSVPAIVLSTCDGYYVVLMGADGAIWEGRPPRAAGRVCAPSGTGVFVADFVLRSKDATPSPLEAEGAACPLPDSAVDHCRALLAHHRGYFEGLALVAAPTLGDDQLGGACVRALCSMLQLDADPYGRLGRAMRRRLSTAVADADGSIFLRANRGGLRI